ncbi:AEC family transporter [Roseobacter ponti]|uniref:AEC family transporter n=1 Tax=Roseobacter ponti TaxID=1891787 RepID=A0A858SSG1_9RHOB|nr:AEC family transporter [Roseobacter ponti]QJF49846.1 AEC family transporter [Roseobacter ponti]
MIEIFLKTVPFFALIGLGYWAGATRFFTAEATAYLTKFVFYFALSAMIFRFTSNLELSDVWDGNLVLGYLAGTIAVYLLATGVAMLRKQSLEVTAVEAQCAVIGNVGFLGIPMLTLLLGEAAIGPVVMTVSIDLIVFSGLIVILITLSREGRLSIRTFGTVGLGLVRNPMIMSVVAGLTWAWLQLPIPAPMNDFLTILGGAATPGALFAIGASLSGKSAERMQTAAWLTFCKLGLHPLFVACGVIWLFPVDPYTATVVISAAALPVAGNVYILAQHYGVAPQRVSTAILVSTIVSILTVSGVIAALTAP